MSATNKTQHYDLSQFIGSDIPGWLSDYNGDMRKIDTAINNIASAEASGEATVAELSGRVTTAENGVSANASAITALNNTVSGISSELTTTEGTVAQNTTNITGLTTRVGAVETAESNTSAKVTALENAMGDTDISSIGDGTVTGAIADLAAGGSSETYSTSEVDTGKVWIDGKHIFRKVVTKASVSASGEVIDATLTNSYIDTLIKCDGAIKSPTDTLPLTFVDVGSSSTVSVINFAIGTTGLRVNTDNAFAGTDLVCIVEYTKASVTP